MKPVLVAMNNPQSPYNRDHVLYPHPEGCAGHRLWRMLDTAARDRHEAIYGDRAISVISKRAYLEGFDRRNLLYALEWSAADARRAAGDLLPALRGRVAAILGTATRKALRLPEAPWGEWHICFEHDFYYVLLPHPSGRCREYNDPAARAQTGRILLSMFRHEVT